MKINTRSGQALAVVALGLGAVVVWQQPMTAQTTRDVSARSTQHHGRGKGRGQGRDGRHGLSLERLTRKLGLTAQQQAQVKPILESARASKQSVRANTALSREEKRAQLRQSMTRTKERISAILTPEQKAKFAQTRHKRGGGGKGRGKAGSPLSK